jgi:hypothetical protein
MPISVVVVASSVLVLMRMTKVAYAMETRVVGRCVRAKVPGDLCGLIVRY